METIIVATDLSPEANNATLYAVRAAQALDRKIVLFHLYKASAHESNARIHPTTMDLTKSQKENNLNIYAGVLENNFNIRVDVVVRTGDFLDEIQKVIEQQKASMVVMGMPKKSINLELWGSTTTEMIGQLKVPVLAIPEHAKYRGFQKILYACDPSKSIDMKILEVVKEYAHFYQAEVEVFHVTDSLARFEVDQSIKEQLSDVNLLYKNANSLSVVHAIQEEAEMMDADILVMTPHKYGFWSSLVHKSKTSAMATNGKIPLLSISY